MAVARCGLDLATSRPDSVSYGPQRPGKASDGSHRQRTEYRDGRVESVTTARLERGECSERELTGDDQHRHHRQWHRYDRHRRCLDRGDAQPGPVEPSDGSERASFHLGRSRHPDGQVKHHKRSPDHGDCCHQPQCDRLEVHRPTSVVADNPGRLDENVGPVGKSSDGVEQRVDVGSRRQTKVVDRRDPADAGMSHCGGRRKHHRGRRIVELGRSLRYADQFHWERSNRRPRLCSEVVRFDLRLVEGHGVKAVADSSVDAIRIDGVDGELSGLSRIGETPGDDAGPEDLPVTGEWVGCLVPAST